MGTGYESRPRGSAFSERFLSGPACHLKKPEMKIYLMALLILLLNGNFLQSSVGLVSNNRALAGQSKHGIKAQKSKPCILASELVSHT